MEKHTKTLVQGLGLFLVGAIAINRLGMVEHGLLLCSLGSLATATAALQKVTRKIEEMER